MSHFHIKLSDQRVNIKKRANTLLSWVTLCVWANTCFLKRDAPGLWDAWMVEDGKYCGSGS